jgi:hypothetical protein
MNVLSILALILLALVLVYVFIPAAPSYSLQLPFDRKTADFSVLRNLFLQRFSWIQQNTGAWKLSPYDARKLQLTQQVAASSTSFNQFITLNQLTPNFFIGYYPLAPLPTPSVSLINASTENPALQASVFQFEQGCIGWYWGYATDVSASSMTSVMFYIVKLDICNPIIRKQYSSLQPAETAIYYLSFGVGTKDTQTNEQIWEYSPYFVTPGHYAAQSPRQLHFRMIRVRQPLFSCLTIRTHSRCRRVLLPLPNHLHRMALVCNS